MKNRSAAISMKLVKRCKDKKVTMAVCAAIVVLITAEIIKKYLCITNFDIDEVINNNTGWPGSYNKIIRYNICHLEKPLDNVAVFFHFTWKRYSHQLYVSSDGFSHVHAGSGMKYLLLCFPSAMTCI